MTLTPTDETLCPVKLAMDVDRLTLYTEDGQRSVTMFEPPETVALPAGSYRLLAYQVLRADEWGDKWRVSARGSTETPFVDIGGAEATGLTFGEPFTPVVSAPRWSIERWQRSSGKSDELRLSFNVEGVAQELLSDLRRTEGKQTQIAMSRRSSYRPKEPSYRIIKTGGEVVASGSFEYG